MLKKRLQRIYDLALASDNEKHFFLWLYDYVRVFDREDEMKGFSEVVDQDRQNDFGRIHELEPLAIKEIDKAYKQVAKYVKEKKIEHPVIKKELGEYELAKKGDYSSSRGHLEDLYDKLSYVLMTMVEDGTEGDLKFAQKFGTVSDERRITEWTFSPSYTEYELLKDGLKKIQETRLWYAWNKITLAFRTIDDYKHDVVKELLGAKRHFEAMNWSGLYTEMMGIIDERNNQSSHVYEFKSKDYRYFLAKVNVAAEAFVQNGDSATSSVHKKVDVIGKSPVTPIFWEIRITKVDAVVIIQRQPFSFALADRPGQVLKYLATSNEDVVSWDAVYEAISGSEPSKDNYSELKEKIYWAVQAVNDRVFNELKISNFIKYRSGQLCFNEDYERVPDQTSS